MLCGRQSMKLKFELVFCSLVAKGSLLRSIRVSGVRELVLKELLLSVRFAPQTDLLDGPGDRPFGLQRRQLGEKT